MLYSLYDNEISVYDKTLLLLHSNMIPTISYVYMDYVEIPFDSFMFYLQSYGKPDLLKCSFNSIHVKEKSSYGVVLLHYLTGPFSQREQLIIDAEIQSFRDIDKNV